MFPVLISHIGNHHFEFGTFDSEFEFSEPENPWIEIGLVITGIRLSVASKG